MTYSQTYYDTYQNLPEELPEIYPELNFDNHCYLRIALDNTFQTKWDTQLKRPAYRNLDENELQEVIGLLTRYKSDKAFLLEHNQNSLAWRKKSKTRN